MKFSTKEDIEAPLDHVFARLTDFDGLERSALRRGAEVTRVDTQAKAAGGSIWDATFDTTGWRYCPCAHDTAHNYYILSRSNSFSLP